MLGCIQPMSSPMMKRMLGFCCCCAAAGRLAAVTAASDANRPSQMYLATLMLELPRSAARDGPAACAHLAIAVGPICVNTLCKIGEVRI